MSVGDPSSVESVSEFWRKRWASFWFAPALPYDLAACRAVFFAGLFAWYATHDFSAWGDVDAVFWHPLPLFRLLFLRPASPTVLAGLAMLWKASLLLSALGLFTRASTAIAAVLGLYLLGLPHNFGKVNHNDAVVVITLAILAFSRCGDALSLDAAWRRGRDPSRDSSGPLPSGEYTWPIRGVWVLLSLAYFAAGVSKLKIGPWAWTTSDTMAIFLLQSHHEIANAPPLTGWGPRLATLPWLCRGFAAMTLLVELGYPLALWSRTLRWFFVPAAVATHIGVRLLLGPTFEEFILCAVFWVPWHDVYRRLQHAK